LQGAKRSHHNSNQQPLQSPQPQQPQQNQFTVIEDQEGKKRLVIRPTSTPQQLPSPAQQVQVQQDQRSGISAPVQVNVCDPQQPVPQSNTAKIHVTPVTVTPPLAQQGLQQQSTGIYAGQVGLFMTPPRADVDWCYQQYSPQQQNPYAYACYTPSNASQQSSTPSPSSSSSSGTSSSSLVPVAAYQQQSGYFGNASNGAYLGVGMGLGINSLMGGGYSQAQLATFHQQFKEQYRGFATQIQQQQQQQAQPANEDPTV
jgi:hypothetical protein